MNLRHSIRVIRKSPGFAATVIVTLALGIGANTAIFSVVDALLWRPLPLREIQRVCAVTEVRPERGGQWDTVAPATYREWRRAQRSFEHLAAYTWGRANLSGPGAPPEPAEEVLATEDFFRALEGHAVLGRTFNAEEKQGGRERVAVLSHHLWQRRYGGDPAIVGREILIDGRASTVIGLMGPGFVFPPGVDLWTPLVIPPEAWESHEARQLIAIGRLRAGVTRAQARAEFESLAALIAEAHPKTNRGWTAAVLSINEFIAGDLTPAYSFMCLGAVVFVLLIACANVANLQFARATRRAREIAVRAALGAGRWRVVRQLLLESALLSLAGAAAGLLLAAWAVDTIQARMPPEVERFLPGWKALSLNWRAVTYAMASAGVAALLSGLAPALQAYRSGVNTALKEGARASASRSQHRLRSLLVMGEIALATVLLIGAGIITKGFSGLHDRAAAYQPERLLTLRLALNGERYQEPHRTAAFLEEVLKRWEALPGVRSAALASALPYSDHSTGRYFVIEGRPEQAGERPSAQFQAISPSYFRTLGVPLLRGREFTGADRAGAPPVAMISRQMAERFWPGQDPTGRRIRVAGGEWMSIVGVVDDVPHSVYERAPRAVLYLSYLQSPRRFTDVAIRTSGDPLRLVPAAQAVVWGLDPQQPLAHVKSMARLLYEHITGLRFVVELMTVMGGLALALACVGVYAVMAYAVSERTHEIGVRMALGARQRQVLGMVVRRGALLAGGGLAAGLALAFGMARLLARLVFGVSATDPATFWGFALVLTSVALAASYIPARRAAAVDPVRALRYE